MKALALLVLSFALEAGFLYTLTAPAPSAPSSAAAARAELARAPAAERPARG